MEPTWRPTPEPAAGPPEVRHEPSARPVERPPEGPEQPRGDLHGVSAEGVIRLLEAERKTCTLIVRSGEQVGFLFFLGGELADARVGALTGLHAAFRALSWPAPSFELCAGEEDRVRSISEPVDKVLEMARKASRHGSVAASSSGASRPGALAAGLRVVPDADVADPLLDVAGFETVADGVRRWPSAGGAPAEVFLTAEEGLRRLLETPADGAAIVDVESGMCLESAGEMPFFEIVAAMSTEILTVEEQVVRRLASRDRVEDVLVTLGQQLHVLRPVRNRDGFCVFAVFDRRKTKLAWARYRVAEVAERLRF